MYAVHMYVHAHIKRVQYGLNKRFNERQDRKK